MPVLFLFVHKAHLYMRDRGDSILLECTTVVDIAPGNLSYEMLYDVRAPTLDIFREFVHISSANSDFTLLFMLGSNI